MSPVFLQETYHDLMEKVLDVFGPGKFLMTIFANKVSPAYCTHSPSHRSDGSLRTGDLHKFPPTPLCLSYPGRLLVCVKWSWAICQQIVLSQTADKNKFGCLHWQF